MLNKRMFFVKHRKIATIAGMIGSVLYLGAIIAGTFLQPGYKQILQTVSYLNALGAPHKLFFDIIFLVANLLLIIFAVYLFFSFKNKNLKLGATFLKIISVLNIILILFFPIHYIDSASGLTDIVHQNLVNLLALSIILAIFFLSLSFKKIKIFKNLSLYSFLTLLAIIIFWIITAIMVNTVSPVRGLFEKISILIFLQWIFILSLKLYKSS